MPRIALVTTDVPELLAHEFDLEPLLAEFARRSIRAEAPVWHDPTVDWERFDLIVMRSPWDYPQRIAEFLAWLDSLPASRVLNPPALIRWNLDKRYLLDLEALGRRYRAHDDRVLTRRGAHRLPRRSAGASSSSRTSARARGARTSRTPTTRSCPSTPPRCSTPASSCSSSRRCPRSRRAASTGCCSSTASIRTRSRRAPSSPRTAATGAATTTRSSRP